MSDLKSSKFLSQGELSHLNGLLLKSEKTDQRDVLFIRTLLLTGARVSEVLGIRGMDLILEDRSVFLRGSKNSKDREIPLPIELWEGLRFLSRARGVDERIFKFGYARARVIWCKYRPVKKKMHSLRHTCAMEIYRRTKNIRLVQKVLGHRSLTNTMIYTDYDYSRAEMRKALF